MDELKEKFKTVIETKLSDPNVSADDILKLAGAYSELTKNDWMKDTIGKLGSTFNGPPIPQIVNETEES